MMSAVVGHFTGVAVLRRFFSRLFPARAEEMEAESRAWIIRCERCGGEQSVWDAGGMRYRSRGAPRRVGKCGLCGRTGLQRLSYRPAAGDAPETGRASEASDA
jgi:hypothetical protein